MNSGDWRAGNVGIDLSKYNTSNLTRANVKSLIESMCTTLDANEKIWELFGSVNPTFLVPCLEDLSRDLNPETACNATEMLVFLEGQKAISWVEKLLEHEDERVRGAGCILLSRLDCAEARALLAQRLQSDESGNVRFAAADGLEAVGDLSSIPALNCAAETDEGTDFEGRPVRDQALDAIHAIQTRL